ncbi:MAG TPA: class I SAM-dependent methyltransferase [Sphingomicrobium sp.]|nr:class I SAM-dependent methyltransferase [Sphingomicrobium sp.]
MPEQEPTPATPGQEAAKPGYNERLFDAAGLRSFYHLARFKWAEEQVRTHCGNGLKVLELGCFDGRLFDHIRPQVADYVGIDANWEGGLDLARRKYAGVAGATFLEATDPKALRAFADREFDVTASLETLEHLPPELLPAFLDELARVTAGQLLVTVPNELGPVFLAKYLLKRLRYGDADDYSVKEAVAATLGQTHKVRRCEHKGFDYRQLIGAIGARFNIASIEGLPFAGLPPLLSPTVAIRAVPK